MCKHDNAVQNHDAAYDSAHGESIHMSDKLFCDKEPNAHKNDTERSIAKELCAHHAV